MTADPSTPSSVRIEQRGIAMAELGPQNPLPALGAPLENPYRITGALPAEILEGAAYGHPRNLYPYQLQDGYGRESSERSLRTVVLENEHLRAVFLPELGGRLWELFDKRTGKDLVYTQPCIQFANLALRNAWFAGGIEWNIGTRGHSPTTCSPLHAGILRGSEGQQVLRMWELERLRQVVFSVDAWLPAGSPVLLVTIRVRNPNAVEVPMYWWTNAAVPEDPGSRVIAPAVSAFASSYTDGIARVDPTRDGGVDCTWPTNNARARDFFFDVAADQRRWILSADADGDGLAMLSTDVLRGRKLFVWGQGAGGRRWQDWLSPAGGRYAEIQAGLAQTQFQHLAMPAGATWSWTEAYGNARVDPEVAHGRDWAGAIQHCAARVDSLLSRSGLQSRHQEALGRLDQPPRMGVVVGTGWGALESEVRRRHGVGWVAEAGTPFPVDSIGQQQQPWLDLLHGAGFSGASSYVAGAAWEVALEQQPESADTLLHRGYLLHARDRLDEARALYQRVLNSGESALARRALALTDLALGHRAEAVEGYVAACALEPASRPLLVEAVTTLIGADAPDRALALLEQGGHDRGEDGRLKLLRALALARVGDHHAAASILRAGVEVPDIREGENSISELWRQVCPGEEIPAGYQFSMGSEAP